MLVLILGLAAGTLAVLCLGVVCAFADCPHNVPRELLLSVGSSAATVYMMTTFVLLYERIGEVLAHIVTW